MAKSNQGSIEEYLIRSSYDLFYMLFTLLLVRPQNELVPIFARMHDSEPMNAVDGFVHDFQCRVGLTHQALPEEINAMANVTRSNIDMDVLVRKFCPVDRSIVVGPVAFANVVLTHSIRKE